jgi:hypothetical protein
VSDPIKAAVEAAARAMVRIDWKGAESIQEFEDACWPDREEEAAAAIAAFLRALPNGTAAWAKRSAPSGVWQPAPDCLSDLAFAVERWAPDADDA